MDEGSNTIPDVINRYWIEIEAQAEAEPPKTRRQKKLYWHRNIDSDEEEAKKNVDEIDACTKHGHVWRWYIYLGPSQVRQNIDDSQQWSIFKGFDRKSVLPLEVAEGRKIPANATGAEWRIKTKKKKKIIYKKKANPHSLHIYFAIKINHPFCSY